MRDPRTGVSRDMHLDFETIVGALQPLTYAPEAASLMPELLALARSGDYAPLLAAALVVVGDLPEQFNAALLYSVTCAEDVPRVTREERMNGVADGRVRALARRAIAVCDRWPQGGYPADFATPVKSDVPVLLLSGGLDPVTPPAYGEEVAKGLPNSRHIVAAATATSCRRTPARRGSSRRSSTTRASRRCRKLRRLPRAYAAAAVLARSPGAAAMIASSDWPRRSASAAKCTRCATCRSTHRTARSPACSVPTAPARRRCCACSRRWSCPTPAARASTGSTSSRDRYAVRARIGVLSDARGLYPRLTARENVRYYGALHGLSGARARAAHRRAVRDARPLADRRSARGGVSRRASG